MKVHADGARRLAAALIISIALAMIGGPGCGGNPGAGSIAAAPAAQVTAPQVSAAPRLAPTAPAPQGIPHDWSHRHLIFSRPQSASAARQLEREPRFRIQQAWRASQSGAGGVEARMRTLDALAVQLASAPTRGAVPLGWGRPLWGDPKRRLHSDWSVSLGSGATVGAGMYPAKYSFNPIGAPDCTNDFVVFNTSKAGGTGQASIVAYNELYSGLCSGVPTVRWAYSTGGTIKTSVVLSADGSQVAFIHSGSVASLVLLKWAPSTSESVTSPLTLTAVSNASYPGCTAPCITTLTFVNNVSDTKSAPFYDYTNDIIYVGDDNGYLHKFTSVFKGSPTEVTTAGSPWTSVQSGDVLTSPVLDSGASPPVVFVGVVNSGSSGGYLAYVNTSTLAVSRSKPIGHNTIDFADAPLVDSVAGNIYLAVGNDGSNHSGVFLFNRGFANNIATGSEAQVGLAATTTPLPVYDGDFDNTYYNSSNATGNLYVCGNAGGNPTLYQVHISAGTFPTNNVLTGPSVAGANITCSPVTEVYNPSASGGPFDWIFLSVQNNGSPTICASGGCAMNFNVTAWQASFAYALNQVVLDSNLNVEKVTTAGTSGASQPTWNATAGGTTSDGTHGLVWTNQGALSVNAAAKETGGTSGIVIDNTSSAAASQVYFSTLTSGTCGSGSGGCAVQASQAGLQ